MSNQVKSFLFSPFKKKRSKNNESRANNQQPTTKNNGSSSYGRDSKGRLKKGYKIDQDSGKVVKA